MRIHLKHALCALATAGLLLAAGAAFAPQGPALADEIEDTIDAMEEAAKDKDAGACIAKMVELQDSLDERVSKALAKLVKNREVKIAAAAVRELAKRKDESFGKAVGRKIGDKKLYKEEDKRDLYLAYLDAAAIYGSEKYLDDLEDVVKKFMPTDSEFTTKAIKAFGAVREKEVVDQLIEWLVQSESTGQSQGGKNMSDETRENYGKAKSQIVETLAELTGQDIGDSKSWQDFWERRKKTFQFPDPNAAEVDPATLEEWSDIAYGYTVRKPDGTGWAFKKTEWDAIRMRLEKLDEDELVMVRVDFQIHNLSSQSPKTMKALAEWYVQDYKDNRFSDLRGAEPQIEERKIGGREFLVVSAKGDSGGAYKGWGTAEMRAYLTQVEHIVVRMEGTARLGAEPEDRAALWNVIEKAEWLEF